MEISSKVVGKIGNEDIIEYFLQNSKTKVYFINFGVTILSFQRANAENIFEELTLNYRTFDELYSHLTDSPYYGCVVGRVANR